MSVEENLQNMDANIETFNARDWDRFLGFRTESYVFHTPDLPEPLKGREAMGEYLQGLVSSFPDLHIKKAGAFGQGDWISLELDVTGTNKGPLPGPGGETIPATNKQVRFWNLIVAKYEGDKITEEHRYFDQLGLMAQLGLAP